MVSARLGPITSPRIPSILLAGGRHGIGIGASSHARAGPSCSLWVVHVERKEGVTRAASNSARNACMQSRLLYMALWTATIGAQNCRRFYATAM